MSRPFDELRARLGEVWDLRLTTWLLEWDQEVMMPRGGAAVRAEQLATIERVAHERATADELGRLLDELDRDEAAFDPDSFEASLIRVARRDWEKARRIPTDLQAEMARAAVEGFEIWMAAREASDYARFRPALERNLELRRRYVECFDGFDDPYDVLLDDFEPDMKTAEAEAVLVRLRDALVPLAGEIADASPVDSSFLSGPFPIAGQKDVEVEILRRLGFEPTTWRLDEIVHPAAYSFGTADIRITTRYSESNLETLFSAMHEFGHGLYEHQIDPALNRTPLATGVSLGLHESQSRLWENLVGRSLPFWRGVYPLLAETFPDVLAGVDTDAFHRAVNKVEPSLIRVDADEVTYNLHIVLRFELERRLLAGTLSLSDLPEAWNAGMREYLGVEVPDDARGVLQDVHWSSGGIGYFPTYSLGNVISVQIWEQVRKAIPDLDEQMEQGEFGELRGWLCDHVHRFGRMFSPRETLERAVGGPIDPEPYLAYLRAKAADLYGVGVQA
jgi:carboxypeptidase Taq